MTSRRFRGATGTEEAAGVVFHSVRATHLCVCVESAVTLPKTKTVMEYKLKHGYC